MNKNLMTLLTVVLMAGFSINAKAQTGFNVSLKATPQFSFLLNQDDFDNSSIEKDATFRANFGIGAGYNFSQNIGIGLDVLYGLQGQKMKVSGIEVDQRLDYVKIPLYLSYNSDPTKSIGFYGNIGPQINILARAETSLGDSDQFLDNKDKYQAITFGGMVTVGSRFKLTEKLSLQTGLYFDIDFMNAEDKDFPGYSKGRADTYNMNTGIQVGLKYQL